MLTYATKGWFTLSFAAAYGARIFFFFKVANIEKGHRPINTFGRAESGWKGVESSSDLGSP